MAACITGWLKFDMPWWPMIVLAVIYIHLLVLGAIYISWNFYMPAFHDGSNKKQVALTFDDGPAKETEAILDVLKEQHVAAAFFSIGKNAKQHPEIVERWVREGHLVGNHSYDHGFNFDWKSSAAMLEEITATNKTIYETAGVKPKFFRPPYGVTNPNLAKAVKRSGMYAIGWNLRSFDTTAKDGKALLQKILRGIKGGDIILLHDSMTITREILTELIVETRKMGFTFVRVDQMLDLQAYE